MNTNWGRGHLDCTISSEKSFQNEEEEDNGTDMVPMYFHLLRTTAPPPILDVNHPKKCLSNIEYLNLNLSLLPKY